MIVELKGRDLWRGRFKSIEEALENETAAIGVDRVLLSRAEREAINTVMVVVEEQRRIFLAPIKTLMDTEVASSRTGFNGRTQRVMDYRMWHVRYLGPEKTVREKRNTHLQGL